MVISIGGESPWSLVGAGGAGADLFYVKCMLCYVIVYVYIERVLGRGAAGRGGVYLFMCIYSEWRVTKRPLPCSWRLADIVRCTIIASSR